MSNWSYMSRSLEVRSQFALTAPLQILKALRILACDTYGLVVWRLESPPIPAFFKAYTTCIRRIFRLSISTFTYLAEGQLAAGIPPLRHMDLGDSPSFTGNYCTPQ